MKKFIEFIKENDVWVLLALIAIVLVVAFLTADAACTLAAVIPSASVKKLFRANL